MIATHKNNLANNNHSVLVIDSGVGGLSILFAIAEKTTALNLHYVSDNAAFPYGEKTESFLIERVSQLVEKALDAHEADIIVIACNTASTVVLPRLREQLTVPVVGVVPAIKTAGKQSASRVFGLLATPGTVRRDYTQQLIDDYAADCSVIPVGSSRLVELTETYLYTGSLDLGELETILNEFDLDSRSEQIDTLVLGCTHFPLIAKQIQELRPHWTLVDSGNAIARRVCNVLSLEDRPALPRDETNPKRYIHFTDLSTETSALDSFLQEHRFERPLELNLT